MLIIACGRRAYKHTHTHTRINSQIDVPLFVSDVLNALCSQIGGRQSYVTAYYLSADASAASKSTALFPARESNVTRLWLSVFEYLIASTRCLKYLTSGRLGIVPIDVFAALIIPRNALNGRGVSGLRSRENQIATLRDSLKIKIISVIRCTVVPLLTQRSLHCVYTTFF